MKLKSVEREWVKECSMKWRRANPGTNGIEVCFIQRRSAKHGWHKECGMHYPLDCNGSRPIGATRATTSPHVQKLLPEAILFIKSSLVANKTFCQSEL
jgi:hypothetical protein